MTNKAYTGKDIQVLSDSEHVRRRTGVYLGNTNVTTYAVPLLTGDSLTVEPFAFVPAAYRACEEIFGNAVDEFNHITQKNKVLKITADPSIGKFTVSDNGRGVPIDKHASGKHTPEVVFGSMRSGRNFNDNDRVVGIVGVNGVGSSCVNFCSTDFEVTIHRDGKQYYQKFVDGANKVSTPKITKLSQSTAHLTGTEISFQLDPTVFKQIALPDQLMRNRAVELAMTNPGLTVEYNGETFRYKWGMSQVVATLIQDKPVTKFTLTTDDNWGEIFVIPNAHDSDDEQIYTWVNNTLLFDGGKCNTQFLNAFCDRVISHLKRDAARSKSEVTRNDVRHGLLIMANLKLKQPEYDSQSKTRLTGPDLRKEMVALTEEQWKTFVKQNKGWLKQVLDRAIRRFHKQENKKAIESHKKTTSKRVEGLLDATSKNRFECQLVITEGESARSQICEARNPLTTGAFALTGKVNNVYHSTPAQVLGMTKVATMLSAIGLTPGVKADRSSMNFGRVVIATDADVDGSDIFTLLVNLFYKFWPELFDPNYEPVIYRLVSPNVVVSKNKKRIHFTTRTDYDAVKEQYKGWTVEYMKGLGSLGMTDWEMILGEDSAVYIPVIDDGHFNETLKLLFDNDPESRKRWLSTEWVDMG